MKYFIQGALAQLSTGVNPLGLVEHYLWGFEGSHESSVSISEEAHERIRRFLVEGTGNTLHDIEGWMAEVDEDGAIVPFGTPVKVELWIEDRHNDDSHWVFAIKRASVSRATA